MHSQEEELQLPEIFKDSQMIKLQVRQSAVPGAGMGLYATKPIKQFQFISQYYGAIISEKYSFSPPFIMEDKMVYLNKKYCVISRSPASRANDIVKWDPQYFFSPQNKENRVQKKLDLIQGLHRNASIKLVEKDKSFLVASRNIEPGEQIYIDYGFQYWEFFFKKHQNQKQSN